MRDKVQWMKKKREVVLENELDKGKTVHLQRCRLAAIALAH